MIAVRMVQMPVDDVVHVITMRHGLVPTVRAVNVVGFVTCTRMIGRAIGRIVRSHVERVLLDGAIGLRVMKVSVMHEVDVVSVFHGGMPAACAVFVIVIVVCVHGYS